MRTTYFHIVLVVLLRCLLEVTRRKIFKNNLGLKDPRFAHFPLFILTLFVLVKECEQYSI